MKGGPPGVTNMEDYTRGNSQDWISWVNREKQYQKQAKCFHKGEWKENFELVIKLSKFL